MAGPSTLTAALGAPFGSRRVAGDLIGAARYSVSNTLGDLAATGAMHVRARLDLLRGAPEAALLRYGHGIRHVKRARQSLATYKAVDRLVARYPEQLSDYRLPDAAPERFLFFVGYSRSAHSLVGSLLDAHPNVLVAHELHAINLLRKGAPVADVIKAMQYNSGFFTRFGRGYMGYDYSVGSQSQGVSSGVTVIGDKKANGTTAALRRDPGVVDRLKQTLPGSFRFIHVIRNPFDNIASRAQRVGVGADLATYGYFVNVEVNARLKAAHPDLVLDVYLDDLAADPEGVLRELLAGIGVTSLPETYLADCAKLVFSDARRTRDQIDWPDGMKAAINDKLRGYDFLSRFADAA